MNPSKKILLMTACVIACLQSALGYDIMVDGIYYNLNGPHATVTNDGIPPNAYNTHVAIPPTITHSGVTYSVTAIGDSAFAGCKQLKSITIPNTVTTVGADAFSGCTSLTTAILEDGTMQLTMSKTFRGCPLVTLYLGRDVTNYAGSYSPFEGIETLQNLTIGSKVLAIGNDAFADCTRLSILRARCTFPPLITETSFDFVTEQTARLIVPQGCLSNYLDDLNWEVFENISEEVSGDVNGNGWLDIGDVVEMIDQILFSLEDIGFDMNGDGLLNIADVVSLIDKMLEGEQALD